MPDQYDKQNDDAFNRIRRLVELSLFGGNILQYYCTSNHIHHGLFIR